MTQKIGMQFLGAFVDNWIFVGHGVFDLSSTDIQHEIAHLYNSHYGVYNREESEKLAQAFERFLIDRKYYTRLSRPNG